jgi:hypothetical protein
VKVNDYDRHENTRQRTQSATPAANNQLENAPDKQRNRANDSYADKRIKDAVAHHRAKKWLWTKNTESPVEWIKEDDIGLAWEKS